jgi:hypothetical protein
MHSQNFTGRVATKKNLVAQKFEIFEIFCFIQKKIFSKFSIFNLKLGFGLKN